MWVQRLLFNLRSGRLFFLRAAGAKQRYADDRLVLCG